jgi:hypothetical protein
MRKSISAVDNVLCYVKPGDPPANWKIALPKSMLQPTIRWFHQITGHPGSKRLHMQISSRYPSPRVAMFDGQIQMRSLSML